MHNLKSLRTLPKFLSISLSSVVLILVAVLVHSNSVSAFSGSGSGTLIDPFIVSNCSEFEEISNATDSVYSINSDLSCASEGNSMNIYSFGGHTSR
ncbi:MAG: hypothetical protein WCK91_03270 [bacterium]